MAITRGTLWQVTYGFVDRDNNKSYTSVNLAGTLSDTDAYAAALAIANAMTPLSNAALYSMHLLLTSNDPAVDLTAIVEASDVERKGVFQFQGANPNLQVRLEVPSIKNELVVDGTNAINPADAAVIAFQDAILNPAAGAGNGPVHLGGADMTTRKGFPYKMHRGSRKG